MTRDGATLQFHVDQLPPDDRDAFAWLGILHRDAPVGPATAAILWEGPEAGARRRLQRLAEAALVQPVGDEGYRLDKEAREAASQLLAQRMSLAEAHTHLLERYRAKTQDGLWHTVPDDGYIHEHLTWHMEEACREDEIHALLEVETPEKGNAWFEMRETLGQTAGCLADVSRAWRLAEREPDIALECRYALISSSVSSRAGSIEPALLLALVETGIWNPAQGLAYARRSPRTSLRAESLASLLPHLAEPLREQVLDEALEAARPVKGDWYPSKTLAYMLPYLSEPQRTQMIEEALTRIFPLHAGWEIWILPWLIPHLPEPRKAQVVSEVVAWLEKMDDELYRADLVMGFAPYMPDSLRNQVIEQELAYGLEAEDEGDRAETLAHLIPYLSEPGRSRALEEALASVGAIPRRDVRLDVLVFLARQLPDARRKKVLSATLVQELQIQDAGYLGGTMGHLALEAPALEQPRMLGESLETIGRDTSPWSRARALADLIPLLPQEFKAQALSDALIALQEFPVGSWLELEKLLPALTSQLGVLPAESILEHAYAIAKQHEGEGRVTVLASFAPHLTGVSREQVVAEALNAVPQIWLEDWQARALGRLAPYLTPALWETALLLTEQLKGALTRAAALAALAPHLPTALLQEALAMALQIKKKGPRARALAGLAPHFSEPQRRQMMEESLSLARKEKDASRRARLLVFLASSVPDDLLAKVVSAARAIRNEYAQAEALTGMVPGLPERLQAETVKRALTTVRKLQQGFQGLYFVPLLPYMTQAQKEETLETALGRHDFHLLAELIPYLSGLHREGAIEGALHAALDLGLQNVPAAKFTEVAHGLAGLPSSRIEPLWRAILPVMATRARYDLLHGLQLLTPVIVSLGGAEAAAETYRAVQNAGRWWP